MEVTTPAASLVKPPPRKAAGTLAATQTATPQNELKHSEKCGKLKTDGNSKNSQKIKV